MLYKIQLKKKNALLLTLNKQTQNQGQLGANSVWNEDRHQYLQQTEHREALLDGAPFLSVEVMIESLYG